MGAGICKFVVKCRAALRTSQHVFPRHATTLTKEQKLLPGRILLFRAFVLLFFTDAVKQRKIYLLAANVSLAHVVIFTLKDKKSCG